MAIRKNKKRIDPRYFLNETRYRDLKEDSFSDEAKKLSVAAAQRASNIAGREVSPRELGNIGGNIMAMIYHDKIQMPDWDRTEGDTWAEKVVNTWLEPGSVAYPELDKLVQAELQRLGAKKQPAQPSAQPAADVAGAQKSAGYDKQAARFQENLGDED